MARDDVDAVDHDAIAAVDVGPSRAGRLRLPAAARVSGSNARHRNALPHLARPELAEDRGGAADVIGIAVGQREVVEPPNARVAQDRRDDAIADVEGGSGDRPPASTSSVEPRGKAHERRVALPDVEERDVQPAVAARGDERPRLGENPDRRAAAIAHAARQRARDARAAASRSRRRHSVQRRQRAT